MWGTMEDADRAMRLPRTFVTVASFACAAMLAACGHKAAVPTFATIPQQPPIQDQGFIKHVIVIVQENRSFDNMFNGFPGADTVSQGNANGTSVPIGITPFEDNGLDVGHTHPNFSSAYDGGRMDNFNGEGTFKLVNGMYTQFAGPPNYAYSHLPQSETVPLWDLATQFTLADHMFASNSGP